MTTSRRAHPTACSVASVAALLAVLLPMALLASNGPTTATILSAPAPAPAAAGDSALATIWPDYDAARSALANDRLGDLARPAKQLQRTIDGWDAAGLSADRAGVPPEKIGEVRELLPDLRKAAQALASSPGLVEARKA